MDEREKMIEQVCLTFRTRAHPTVTFHRLGGGAELEPCCRQETTLN